MTGEQLTSLLHPAVTDLDLADCSIRHHHLAALAAACTNLRCGRRIGQIVKVRNTVYCCQ